MSGWNLSAASENPLISPGGWAQVALAIIPSQAELEV